MFIGVVGRYIFIHIFIMLVSRMELKYTVNNFTIHKRLIYIVLAFNNVQYV